VCLRRTSWDLAQQIAQDAVAQHFDPRYQRWDPQREPELFKHIARLVRGLVSNHRQKRGVRYESPWTHEELAAVAPAIDPPQARFEDDERALAVLRRVRERAAADAAVLDLLEAALDGDGPAVTRTGPEIRNARRRLAGHVESASREIDEEVPHAEQA
jgi:hypothetical protein